MKKILFICILSILIFPMTASAIFNSCDEISEYPRTQKVCEAIESIGVILMWLAMGVAVLIIIIAGIQYMTAGDSEDRTKKAKKTIINGLIGVAIILLAAFLVGLVSEIIVDKFDLLEDTMLPLNLIV
jgi:Na+/proline symporter